MTNYLPEGRLVKVYHGGNHDVFHICLMPQAGVEHRDHHIKYRYDTRQFFDQEKCWDTPQNRCPAKEQFERET